MSTIESLVRTKILRLGAVGEDVKQLQLALAKLGYPLRGTGYFGTATDTAVEQFQRKAGLDPDGDVGTMTARAIDTALAAPRPGTLTPPSPAKIEVQRPLWLQAGLGLLNTKEAPGGRNNPTIIDWAKEEGGYIAREYTADAVPWCALFIGHILTKAGIKGTGTLWALDYAGKWPSVKLLGPAVGAIAPMKRQGGGHVICVVGRDQHGNIMGLGGNQSDQVSVIPFPMSRLNQGFWWPNAVPLPQTGFSSLPVVLSNGRISSKES